MELALSVGGEPTRKCSIPTDRMRQGFPSNSREDRVRGGLNECSPLQLDLKLSWSTEMGNNYESRSFGHISGFDVNQSPSMNDPNKDTGPSSSDSHPMAGRKRDWETEAERASSRCSDEEEGGSTRKKLRLSKEQSCYLEESFKEHSTLNPKQKLALAKQLNLRPRQVEVWFQNRRARTKLKQTEVDCEYLKRCCESLTEENRRLHKELQELKALKSSPHPFHVHVPPTTLTMCPSCERIATTSTAENAGKKGGFGVLKSRLSSFSQHTSAA
ncbi:homeobox-leucine zipper protein HAT14-like [Tasmannia lanceolata]|uniref:homeobox-leucine zipper protein HAT14-like n=1 Tax=Tasmannia lanceolata TaxID=3420 RepID=UPI0040634F76